MRFVPVKSIDQQARLACHRVREGYKTEALAIGNRMRGLLAEFGVVVAQSDSALRRLLGDLEAQVGLPGEFKELLQELRAHWTRLHEMIDACDARIAAHARDDERCVRLRAIIGIGPITADAAVATIGSAHEFRNGRQLAAWLGADAALQRWPYAVGHDQLSRRCLPAHTVDPGRAKQFAARQSGQHREGHARAIVDTCTRWADAVRQGAGGDCQQTCQADVGDAGTRGRLRSARSIAEPHAPATPRSLETKF